MLRIALILIWCSLAAAVGANAVAVHAEMELFHLSPINEPPFSASLVQPAIFGTLGTIACVVWFSITRYRWPFELAKCAIVVPLVAYCSYQGAYGLFGQFYASQIKSQIITPEQSFRTQFKQVAEHITFHGSSCTCEVSGSLLHLIAKR